MERRRPPGTEEGWYALHDLRRIDWDGWRDAPERARERAIGEGVEYLRAHEALEDAEAGGSAVFSVVGHEADLMVLHLRPTLEHLDRAQRRFEATALAGFTERADSYVSVTEVSGYMHDDLTDGLEDVEDEGMRSYMEQRIYPEIPDAEHVCFYPMDKRRGPEHNWYDLPFEERAEYMSAHGEVGREYAGRVTQIITGSVGLDDHEWGVTLFADDPTDIKELLYEMRFDPSSSLFAEFGSFHVGRRFPPGDLGALLAGEAVPTDESLEGGAVESPSASTSPEGSAQAGGDADGGDDDSGGRPSTDAAHSEVTVERFATEAGTYGVDVVDADVGYGLLFESDAPAEEVADEVDGLRANFDHYDTHVETVVRAGDAATAVVSLWANERAANTASGFLADLPGVSGGVGADLGTYGAADDADADAGGESAETDGESAAAGGSGDTSGGRPQPGDARHEEVESREFQRRVHRFGVNPDDHSGAGYALLFRSDTVAEDLVDEVDDLRDGFENYDTHVLTTVRADSGDTAVISLWANERAANTASGFLANLSGTGPGVGAGFGEDPESTHGSDEDPESTHGSDGDPESTHGSDGGPQSTDGSDEGPESTDGSDGDVRGELADLGIYAGQPHGESVYAMVLYSEADPGELHAALSELRERFGDYDSHVKSAVYGDAAGEGRPAVVSIWDSQDAADRAAGFLADLPGVVGRAGEDDGTFGTMGMFYTVKPDYREEFVGTFEEVGTALEEMDGHLDTRLMVNREDENDMFIASRWREKDDAMAFFRSDSFRDTVEWGREVLDDRPRHVFLA